MQPIGRLTRFYTRKMVMLFKRILRAAGTPHSIALGCAIGFVVGWTPTVGFQMTIAFPICLLLRANFLASVPPIWLTNPATIIPIYGFNYWVGLKVVGGPGLHEFKSAVGQVVAVLKQADTPLAETFKSLLKLTMDFMWPLWIGCFIVGFAIAIPAYGFTYWGVQTFRARIAERMAKRQARRLAQAQASASAPAEPSSHEPPAAA